MPDPLAGRLYPPADHFRGRAHEARDHVPALELAPRDRLLEQFRDDAEQRGRDDGGDRSDRPVVATPAVHLATNGAAYLLGLKEEPW